MLAVLAVVIAGVVVAAALAGGGVRTAIDAALDAIRSAGAATFFGTMAILPLPLSWFTIPAGEAFAAQLTIPGVIGCALLAAGVQIAWCYAAARYLFRPWVQRVAQRRGWTVPTVGRDDAAAAVLLVRLIPGAPLPLQCMVLGAAEVPFPVYFVVSWLMTVPWVVGGVVLGRGVLNGRLAFEAAGLGLLAAAGLAAHLLRRKLRPVTPAGPTAA
jgi:uncharacterized membrane protein YdjX (TVP38/TMEM64 family)